MGGDKGEVYCHTKLVESWTPTIGVWRKSICSESEKENSDLRKPKRLLLVQWRHQT